MKCSNCGNIISQSTNYCNICNAPINNSKFSKITKIISTIITISIIFIGIYSFIGIMKDIPSQRGNMMFGDLFYYFGYILAFSIIPYSAGLIVLNRFFFKKINSIQNNLHRIAILIITITFIILFSIWVSL